MFKKPFAALMFALLVSPVMLSAQNENEGAAPGDAPGPNRFWQATLDGGHYMVALDRISSVSRHKYALDGVVIVDEVTVDSVGQALVRFYHFTPISDTVDSNAATELADKGREMIENAAQRGGPDLRNMVVKKYPTTTHARTVEYLLKSEQELASLYNSVRSSWESGRGRKFSTKK